MKVICLRWQALCAGLSFGALCSTGALAASPSPQPSPAPILDPEMAPTEVDFSAPAPVTRKFECDPQGVPNSGAIIATDTTGDLELIIVNSALSNCTFVLLLRTPTGVYPLSQSPGGYLIASVGYDPNNPSRVLVAATNIHTEDTTPAGYRRIQKTTAEFYAVTLPAGTVVGSTINDPQDSPFALWVSEIQATPDPNVVAVIAIVDSTFQFLNMDSPATRLPQEGPWVMLVNVQTGQLVAAPAQLGGWDQVASNEAYDSSESWEPSDEEIEEAAAFGWDINDGPCPPEEGGCTPEMTMEVAP